MIWPATSTTTPLTTDAITVPNTLTPSCEHSITPPFSEAYHGRAAGDQRARVDPVVTARRGCRFPPGSATVLPVTRDLPGVSERVARAIEHLESGKPDLGPLRGLTADELNELVARVGWGYATSARMKDAVQNLYEQRRAEELAQRADSAARPAPAPVETKRGFLSHVSTDYLLADHFRRALEDGAPGVTYFMASQRGHIPSGDPWCETIFNELKGADRFLILLTPSSVERLWVAFETGAAWMSGRPRVLLAAGGLETADISTPLSALQVLFLDGPRGRDALLQCFDQLGSRPPADPEAFLGKVPDLARAGTEAAGRESGWQFAPLSDGRFLAWEGPLDHLEDRDRVGGERPEFAAALQQAGLALPGARCSSPT